MEKEEKERERESERESERKRELFMTKKFVGSKNFLKFDQN